MKPLTAAILVSTILASIFGRVTVLPYSVIGFAIYGCLIYAIAYQHGSERAAAPHPAFFTTPSVVDLTPAVLRRPAFLRRGR